MRTTALACAALLVFSAVPLKAQTVLDGVYSSAQAQRGARTYANICAHCHEGGEPDADPLFGAEFIDRWREAPLSFLHGFFSKNMPADEPGTLTPATYIDALAFLLRENGYPAGKELKADMLASTLLVGPEGPQPLPSSSLVEVSGCLASDTLLRAASGFTRIRRADAATAEQLAEASSAEPGSAEYTLRNASPTLVGQHVLVRGVFAAPDSINVLHAAATGRACN